MFGLFVDGVLCLFFFFKQKPAYELRISDWSSDVCSSDLRRSSRPSYTQRIPPAVKRVLPPRSASGARSRTSTCAPFCAAAIAAHIAALPAPTTITSWFELLSMIAIPSLCENIFNIVAMPGDRRQAPSNMPGKRLKRSEEPTYELQSLMRISYAVFCLTKKT